jgi:hypothetical protein
MARGRTPGRECKWDVVRQVRSGEQHPAQVCREHRRTESLRVRGRKEGALRGEAACRAGQPTEAERLAQRVDAGERVCAQLALEHAVVQKAVQRGRSRKGTR